MTIERALGVDLKPEQIEELFEQSVEHLSKTLNVILSKKFIDIQKKSTNK